TGQNVVASFWAKASAATSSIYFYVSGSCTGPSVPVPLTTSWTKYTIGSTLLGTCATERLYFYPGAALGASTDVWVDDVELAPTDSATYTFDATNTTAPASQSVVVTDGAGNTTNDALTFVRDTTAPTGSVSVPAYSSTGSVPVT